MITFFAIFLAYLLGSLSFGIISAYFFNIPDPRTFGSKNIGATNMLRSGNAWAALTTLLGDTFKGVLGVLGLSYLQTNYALPLWAFYLGVFAILLGHIFPIYFKFKGGKGVATAAGILLTLHLPLGLATLGIWLLTFWLTRYSSLSAIMASVGSIGLTLYFLPSFAAKISVIGMAVLLLYKHRGNMLRLYHGTESKISQKK